MDGDKVTAIPPIMSNQGGYREALLALDRISIHHAWPRFIESDEIEIKLEEQEMKSEKKARREATLDDEIEYLKDRGNKFLYYLPPTDTGYIVCETPSGLTVHLISCTAKRREEPARTSTA